MKEFGWIAKPLTNLLYGRLQQLNLFIICRKFCLKPRFWHLPNFPKVFIVEVDAPGFSIGVMLMQDQHATAFISRMLNLQQ